MSFSHICDNPKNSLSKGVTAYSHNFGLFVPGCSPAKLASKKPFAMHPVGHKGPQRNQEVEPHSAIALVELLVRRIHREIEQQSAAQAVERLRPRAPIAIAPLFDRRVAAT